MELYEYSPLGQAEKMYNKAEHEQHITERLKTAVNQCCKTRKLPRKSMAADLGLGTSTFNHIVQGAYTARTPEHVIRILRYCGLTEEQIEDVFHWEGISFRNLAANDEHEVEDVFAAVTDDDVEYVFGTGNEDGDQIEAELQVDRDREALARIFTCAEEQAAIRELRKEDHTVYAPVHLGSWLQLQMDLLEEIPHAHLNAFVYKCITRMSDIERYKIKRIIDDLRGEETED